MAKPVLKAEAIRLRREDRLSLNEIQSRLGGHVSRSTLSVWLRPYPLGSSERDEKIRRGVARSYEMGHPAARPIVRTADAFSQAPRTRALHVAAIGVAIEWFTSRGYMVSLPLEQAPYDLVVESDCGLKRVQVKSTTKREKNGSWSVGTHRNGYDHAAKLNAGGKRRRRAYTSNEIDMFFVVTGSRDLYLIPIEVASTRQQLVLDSKYKNFRSLA